MEVIRGPSQSLLNHDLYLQHCAVSANPQTFHQALLLIANLARLAPESVLYNVMPVFTFMGSNVFHRDDSNSFKVVQQVGNALFLYRSELMIYVRQSMELSPSWFRR